LRFPGGEWSKKNEVKGLRKKEKQDSGVWKRKMKALKEKKKRKKETEIK